MSKKQFLSEKLKHIKITQIITAMIGIICVLILLIAANNYTSLKIVNGNVTKMYEETLVPLAEVQSIRANFLKININTKSAVLNYNSTFNEEIAEYAQRIKEHLKNYESTEHDEHEILILDRFKEYYSKYMIEWTRINDILSTGEKISFQNLSKFNKYGEVVEDSMKALRDYDINIAANLRQNSTNIYKSSITRSISLLLASLVLLCLFSFTIISVIKKMMNKMIFNLNKISEGDFNIKIDTTSKNEFGMMSKALSKTIHNISNMLGSIKKTSKDIDNQAEELSAVFEEITSASTEISTAINDVTVGIVEQVDHLTSTTNIFNTFGNNIENIALLVKEVEQNSIDMDSMAKNSNDDMKSVTTSISQISESFVDVSIKTNTLDKNISKINEITKVLNSISEQTNLLALNAAIEAARAGESGKGFAIVADEIRKLAEKAKISSQNINDIINNISDEANIVIKTTNDVNSELNNQVKVIDTSLESFKKIIEEISNVMPKILKINSSINNLNREKNNVIQKIEKSALISEQVSASSEEILASSHEMDSSTKEIATSAQTLNNTTKEMMKEVKNFTLKAEYN